MKALLLVLMLAVGQSEAPRQVGPVLLIDQGKTVEMKYSLATRRGNASGIGIFTTVKHRFIFDDTKATLRTSSLPRFEFYADSGLNLESGIYLIRFDVKSGRREVRVGKVRGRSSTTGVPEDHKIPTTIEEIGNGPNSTKQYRMQPSSSLRPGEYCLIRSADSCFDFGVNP